MVLILIILVAVGGIYYIWQANQTGPGRTIEGIRSLAEIWQKRAAAEGGPEVQMPIVVRQAGSLEPCCCVKVDPYGVKTDKTALYHVRGGCVCYPDYGWVPTDVWRCPGGR